VRRGVSNKRKDKFRISPVILDCSQKYQEKLMLSIVLELELALNT
jgi:hypothetical protein